MNKNNYDYVKKIKFDYHELPSAYLSANPNADELRKQLITNVVESCSTNTLENVFPLLKIRFLYKPYIIIIAKQIPSNISKPLSISIFLILFIIY